MATIIDLTHTIEDGMPVYPEDMPVTLRRIKEFERHGYNNHRLEIGMHAGTHIDGPMHLTESKTYISEIPPERFIGNGAVFDVRNEPVITYKEEYADRIVPDAVVLFYTGHDAYFGTEAYYAEYPVLGEGFAQKLIDKRVKMVGFDSPSPDRHPYTIHTMLLTNNIFILENLTNVGALLAYVRFEIIAVPLPVRADSSFLRVVARVPD
jgi:kynurenine formamidase